MHVQQKQARFAHSSSRGNSTSIRLTVGEIMQAVRSLYADELKVFGRVLLKRLRERAAAALALSQGMGPDAIDPDSMPRIEPRRLRKVCESGTGLLRVEPEEGKEYCVKLVNEPETFLDICSTHDSYRQELWDQLSKYLDNLSGEEMLLPGGRYACARALFCRKLPFLANLSLGKVCHVIQLAISQKSILGYLDGSLVPYRHSEAWVKEQCALHQAATGSGALPVASWVDAHIGLKELLDSEVNPAPGMITMSNVKRLFRSRFEMDLCETVFGYTKLFDLLNDPYFQDVCMLMVRGNGQVIVRRVQATPATPPGVWGPFPVMMPFQLASAPEAELSLPSPSNFECDSLVSPGATPRGRSPSLSWKDPSFWLKESASSNASASTADDSSDSSSHLGDGDGVESPEASSSSRSPHHDCLVVKNTFIDVPGQELLAAKAGARQRSHSVPKDIGSKSRRAVDASQGPRPTRVRVQRAASDQMLDQDAEPVEAHSEQMQEQQEFGPYGSTTYSGHYAPCLDWGWWLQEQSTMHHSGEFHTGPPGMWFPGCDAQGSTWMSMAGKVVDQEGQVVLTPATWQSA